MKALVIETAFLGDAVISVALAEALNSCEPSAEITYLVRPESADLLHYAPAIDHVLVYDKYGREAGITAIGEKAEELNRSEFDVIFSLHTSRRTGLLLEKLRAPRKIGYGAFSSLTDRIVDQPGIQRSARAISLLKPLYPDINIGTLPKLDVADVAPPLELSDVADPIVAIAPGSVWRTKRWLPERFAAVANTLHRDGSAVVFIGSPRDSDTMEEVRSFLTVPFIDLVGRTTIAEVAAVISRSKVLVANDSAPVHIATAVGVPSIVMFGPTVRRFGFAPPAELGMVIENAGVWCRPCTTHGSNDCPIHTHECMTSISVSDVLQGIGKFTERNGS